MSYAMFMWKDEKWGMRRSWRTTYDEATETFETSLAAGPELVKVKKADVLRVNWEGRKHWNMTDVPCSCGGYGADLKEYLLVLDLRKERDAGAPKPPSYVEWRDKLLALYEPRLFEVYEELKKSYPNTPVRAP